MLSPQSQRKSVDRVQNKVILNSVCFIVFSSVAQSCPTLWSHGLQHARSPCPSPSPWLYSNSCPLRCHPTISSSDMPFPFCLQSFPASRSFPVSQFFASGGQSTGVSASVSFLRTPWTVRKGCGLDDLKESAGSDVWLPCRTQVHGLIFLLNPVMLYYAHCYSSVRCLWDLILSPMCYFLCLGMPCDSQI